MNHWENLRFVVLLVLFATLAVPLAAAQDAPYPFTAAQQQAVEKLLRDSMRARLALSSDCTAPELTEFQEFERREHNRTYYPYFAQMDADHDGLTDFVVATLADSEFNVYFFHATATGFQAPDLFGPRVDWLNKGGVIVQPHGNVYLGPLFSDDGFFFGWDPETQRMEPVAPPGSEK